MKTNSFAAYLEKMYVYTLKCLLYLDKTSRAKKLKPNAVYLTQLLVENL